MLVEATLQWEEDDGSIDVDVFDGFTRQCELLDHPLPAIWVQNTFHSLR